MAFYKMTFFFEGLQTAQIGVGSSLGWTETWFLEWNGDLDGAINSGSVQDWLFFRLGFLSSIYRVSFLRATEEPIPGVTAVGRSKIRAFAAANGGADGVNDRKGQVQCAMLIDLLRLPASSNERSHHRRLLLRGLPQSLIDGNVIRPSGNAWVALGKFLSFVSGHQTGFPPIPNQQQSNFWMLRYEDPAKNWLHLASVTAAKDGLINVNSVTADPVGTKYRIGRIRGTYARAMNRTWTKAYDSSALLPLGRIRTPWDSSITVIYDGLGEARIKTVEYLYGVSNEYVFIGMRSKKTGKVFRQLAGSSRRRG